MNREARRLLESANFAFSHTVNFNVFDKQGWGDIVKTGDLWWAEPSQRQCDISDKDREGKGGEGGALCEWFPPHWSPQYQVACATVAQGVAPAANRSAGGSGGWSRLIPIRPCAGVSMAVGDTLESTPWPADS